MANVRIRDQGKLTLKDSDNSNEVSLQSPSTVSDNQDFIVPNADGSANNIITTNASGTLSFTDINTLVTGDINWQTGDIKTGDFTAVAGKGYFVNTTGGAITATMPNPPSAGNIVAFKDYAGTFGTNNLTIDRNGHNIQGIPQDSEITTNRASVVLVYNADAVSGWLYTVENNVNLLQPDYVAATGGTITTSGDFKIHTFTSSGTFTVTAPGTSDGSNTVDYLVIAGGGSGYDSVAGGGGGAGGYRESFPNPATGGTPVTAQAYPITVGSGGAASANGASSVFSSITSTGGGAGGNYNSGGSNGGSGGGGGGTDGNSSSAGPAGAGNTPPVSPPQGNNGGATIAFPVGQLGGSGGGGIGGAGSNSPTVTSPSSLQGSGGNGGNGTASSINASPVTRAGGGGGGNRSYNGPHPGPGTGGTAGPGGGGKGGGTDGTSTNGTANTGGGGGGKGFGSFSPNVVGTGGSGLVIIRYKYQN